MSTSNSIKAVSLDLDGVLWNVWPVIARAEDVLMQWLAEYYPRIAEAHTVQSLRSCNRVAEKEQPHIAHDVTALRKEGLRVAAREQGYDEIDVEAAYAVFIHERNKVTLFDDSQALLESLSSRFPMASVSNGNAGIHEIGIGHHFRHAVNPSRAGAKKPDPRIFAYAAELLGHALEDMVHVGDEWDTDIAGALNAGMRAVWYNPNDLPVPENAEGLEVVHEQLAIPAAIDRLSR